MANFINKIKPVKITPAKQAALDMIRAIKDRKQNSRK